MHSYSPTPSRPLCFPILSSPRLQCFQYDGAEVLSEVRYRVLYSTHGFAQAFSIHPLTFDEVSKCIVGGENLEFFSCAPLNALSATLS